MFPIICITEVDSDILSTILTASYKAPDCEPNLILLSSRSLLNSDSFGKEPTQPPISPLSDFPFLSESISSLSALLRDNGKVSDQIFLVADEQTMRDRSLLLAYRSTDDNIDTVRLGEDHCNSQPITLEVGSTGIEEIMELRDEDGVFRGGKRGGWEVRKGGYAPPKKLGT